MAPLKLLSSEHSSPSGLPSASASGSSLINPFTYALPLAATPHAAALPSTSERSPQCHNAAQITTTTMKALRRRSDSDGDMSADDDSGHISPADEVEEALEDFKPQSLPSQLGCRLSSNDYCAAMLARYSRRQRAVSLRQRLAITSATSSVSPPRMLTTPMTDKPNCKSESIPERLEMETSEHVTSNCDPRKSLANETATQRNSNTIVIKQSSSEGYASRSAASSQGGGIAIADTSPCLRPLPLKRRSSASFSGLRASEFVAPKTRTRRSDPTSSSLYMPSTSRPSTRRHSTSVSLCERCWSNLRGTLASPVSFEVGADGLPALIDFTAVDSIYNRDLGSVVLRSAAYGEVVAARRSAAQARRSQRRRAQERARAAAAACDTDCDEEEGVIVIEGDDLPSNAYDSCTISQRYMTKNFASTSSVQSATVPTAPSLEFWNPLGDAHELSQMRDLMRRNVHVPTAVLTDNSTDKEQRPFIINRRSGNAVALPSRVAYAPMPNTERLKVIVVGKSGVGKTTIVFSHHYGGPTEKRSQQSYSATIGAAYFNLDLVNGIPLHLQVWDTAGQERFRCMVPMYVRNASAAVVIYDITDRSSFEEVDRYVGEIKRAQSNGRDPLLILVGNKCDLDNIREVASGEGRAKASMIGAVFFEVAATNTTMVTALLAHIAERIYDTDSELMSRLAASYRSKDKPQGGLRVLKTGEKSFASRCCIIN